MKLLTLTLKLMLDLSLGVLSSGSPWNMTRSKACKYIEPELGLTFGFHSQVPGRCLHVIRGWLIDYKQYNIIILVANKNKQEKVFRLRRLIKSICLVFIELR